jgi:hypothetical protein
MSTTPNVPSPTLPAINFDPDGKLQAFFTALGESAWSMFVGFIAFALTAVVIYFWVDSNRSSWSRRNTNQWPYLAGVVALGGFGTWMEIRAFNILNDATSGELGHFFSVVIPLLGPLIPLIALGLALSVFSNRRGRY